MANRATILVIDDDPALGELLQLFLAEYGYRVDYLSDSRHVLQHVEQQQPQLILLDWMMPHESGIQACQRIRAQAIQTPVIMLTARAETVDRIVGLKTGADDYLCKPFDPHELLARIEAVLRRTSLPIAISTQSEMLFADYRLNPQARELRQAGQLIDLSCGEFDLLLILVQHAKQVLSRDRLLTLMYGHHGEQMERAIDVLIHRLRKVLNRADTRPLIRTVWGKGYLFDATVNSRRS